MSGWDGGPVHPVLSEDLPPGATTGLTLRDYFAGQALGAVLDNECVRVTASGKYSDGIARLVAGHAYRIADAMLAARARPTEQAGEGER